MVNFFSSPVKVTTQNVYEAVNYGTAVAPFYTTLALWVGGLLLTALIKTSPTSLMNLRMLHLRRNISADTSYSGLWDRFRL